MKSHFFLILTVLFLSLFTQAQVVINEVCPRNTNGIFDEEDDNPDWIELYNAGNDSVNMNAYSIADGKDEDDKWYFSDVTIPAKSHLLVFASGKDRKATPENHPHTSFKLSAKGEKVYLYNASGNLIDTVDYPELLPGHAYGRQQDGLQEMHIFTDASPNASNNNSEAYFGYSSQPIFSVQAGFYDNSQTIELSTSEGEIRYTTDGSIPTSTSLLYTQSINIDTTTVICASTFQNDYAPSEPIVNTYFIGEEHTLPVVSVSTNPANLWDDETGIYVGEMYDHSDPNPNFLQNWERPIHLEYFDDRERVVNQNAGIKIHGGYSRTNDNKSFRILARSEYGQSKFKYKFFEHKEITEFKRLILRNAGQECLGNYMSDALAHTIVQHKTNLDIQAYEPVVMYVNGQYWGVRNLREKVDKYYVEENYGYANETVDVITGTGGSKNISEGSSENFDQLKNYILQNDVAQQHIMDSIRTILDVSNFIDYFCSEIFFSNTDWFGPNIKCWYSREINCKWRYVLVDLDCGLRYVERTYVSNFHEFFKNNLLDKLIQNPDFEYEFTIRYADLLNTIFTSENTLMVMQEIEDKLSSEMPRHIDRWEQHLPENWQYSLNTTSTFLSDQPTYTRKHIQNKFSLGPQIALTMHTEPLGESPIHLNTITPETLPWSGIYFKDLPISLSIPKDKVANFSHWKIRPIQAGVDTLASNIKFAPVSDVELTACFGNASALNTIENKAVLIYPNPATNLITIESETLIKAKIFNQTGACVIESSIAQIDISKLPAGLYIVNIETTTDSNQYKLIKN